MNLRQLRYLAVLAQTQNYTKAAKILHITQPTLSYGIKHLEQELAIELFKKEGRNVKLTENGQIFSENIQNVLYLLDHAVEEVKKEKSEGDTVKIASLRTISRRWLPRIISNFYQSGVPRPQKVDFEFAAGHGYSQEMIKALREEKIDICFCSKVDSMNDITYFPVVRQEIVLITPQKSSFS